MTQLYDEDILQGHPTPSQPSSSQAQARATGASTSPAAETGSNSSGPLPRPSAQRPRPRPAREEGQGPQRTIKVILLGNPSVGKTSLLLRFLDKEWRSTAANTGVDTTVKGMTVRGQRVKLVIWDTAGSERFRTLTSQYYRRAQGVILVYDVTDKESFDSLSHWYSELEKHAATPLVKMLVGNKTDKEEYLHQISATEGHLYASRMNSLFMETSVESGINVHEMFTELVENILDNVAEIPEEGSGGTPLGGAGGAGAGAEGRGNGCAC
uniref:Rab family protein n=1 Tax=Volvariella volvacea TaxID=36659 RepID=A0A1B2U6V3_9AGAR|nr:Rab family protein [Volvariella volvacea]